MEKISIIIPVYNAEQYLDKCLLSIKNQTYSNFEAVMINDGSSDDSISICRKYVNEDNRFVLYDEPNRGTGGARNNGLKHITGEYVCFLDSDDWYDLDCLAYLLNGIKECDADVYYGDFKTDNIVEYGWSEAVFTGKEALIELIRGGCCNRINNKIYKREVLGNVFFPEGRDLSEDAAWTANVLANARIVGRGDEAKYNVRITKGSLSRKKFRSERAICGYYRNYLDRCEVFADHYNDYDAEDQNFILSECAKWLEMILKSGCDLTIWDVYDSAKRLVRNHSDYMDDAKYHILSLFKIHDDYRACVAQYSRDLLLSKDKPLSLKCSMVINKITIKVRRILRK